MNQVVGIILQSCRRTLAIEEFNNHKNKFRKIIDRGVWNDHKLIPNQIWYDRCFILHVFDHKLRQKTGKAKNNKNELIN